MDTLIGILTRDVAMGARISGVSSRRVSAGTEVEVCGPNASGWAVVRLPGTLFRQRVLLAGTVDVP